MGSINPHAYLVRNLFAKSIKRVEVRDGYGRGLVQAGEKNKKVVVLCADLAESTRSHWFQQKFPDRFIEVGVAEQNLASLGSGFSLAGKIPFLSSFGVFSPGRNNEQIHTTIAYNNWGSRSGEEINVKIAGSHAGVSTGQDGATHQALEDVALMRLLPGMKVVVPSDALECEKATLAAAKTPGPVYLRFGRAAQPAFTTPKTPFKIGKIEEFRSGKDCTIIANGPLVYEALIAAEKLKKEIDCRVLNCHTVKLLDEKMLLRAARETGGVVTAEEHQWLGGLGGAVTEFLSENEPVPIKRVGVKDCFGESGHSDELMKAFGLTADDIVKAARAVMKMKKK